MCDLRFLCTAPPPQALLLATVVIISSCKPPAFMCLPSTNCGFYSRRASSFLETFQPLAALKYNPVFPSMPSFCFAGRHFTIKLSQPGELL
jgi:hypothetical protein